jgi:hypothetical protein
MKKSEPVEKGSRICVRTNGVWSNEVKQQFLQNILEHSFKIQIVFV